MPMNPGDLKRAHQANLQLLSVLYYCREEVVRKRKELTESEARLIDAEEAYNRSRAEIDLEAMPFPLPGVASGK